MTGSVQTIAPLPVRATGSACLPEGVARMTNSSSMLIELSGEIDLSLWPELTALAEDFERSDHQHVDVDLARVTFCDSQGIGFFARLSSIARDRQGQVTLLNASPRIHSLLKITLLEDRFSYDNRGSDSRTG
jgi:anti-sigma B factor antagonist